MTRAAAKEPDTKVRYDRCYFCKGPEVARIGETKLCAKHVQIINEIASQSR